MPVSHRWLRFVYGGLFTGMASLTLAAPTSARLASAPRLSIGGLAGLPKQVGLAATSTADKATKPPRPAYLSVKVGLLSRRRDRRDRGVLTSSARPTLQSTTPTAPFTECPAVGADTSCGILIDVTDTGTTVYSDPSQGPYDGSDDTLVGVLNSSSSTIGQLTLSSNTVIFGFDGDGLCEYNVLGCPFGPTSYEGPGTSFSNISSAFTGGVVSFSGGVPPGGTAYFSLEAPLNATSVVTGGPSAAEQGGAPGLSESHTTCSAGQPVNCATGTFWHEFTDTSIPGRGVPMRFTRTYSSSAAESDGPLGFGWTDSYNMALTVASSTGAVTVHQEDGSAVTFVSSGFGGFTAPPRVLATLVLNGDGTYTFSRYADHIQYVFSETGQLLSEIDRNGNTTTLAYNEGHLASVTDPSGRSLTFTYTGSRVSSVTDPLGRTISFVYDASGNLIRTTDALGRSWGFTYDASHLLLSMTDPRGGTTTNTYDSSGRVTTQVDAVGRQMTWGYAGDPTSAAGSTTTMTDPRGDVTIYGYTNLELMSITHGAGTPTEATTLYQYDPATLGVTSMTDPDGNVTTHTYDGHGNLLSTADPLSRTTYFSYDSLDDLVYLTDPRGTTTSYSYDANGNLLSKSIPLTETGQVAQTIYSYGAAPGEITGITDPNGNTTSYTYDNAGDRASMTDANGNTTSYTSNPDGEMTAKTTPNGNVSGVNPAAYTTTYTYDAGGELTDETDPLGHTTSYTYDGNGNRVSISDANGHTTKQTYDPVNELVEVIRPDGIVLETQWDQAGNMIAQIDGAGHATTYSYDPLNRLSSVTDPDRHTTSYAYDAAGHKTAAVNAEDQTTSYAYDAAGELTGINYSDGQTPNISEGYDTAGNRTSLTDGSGTSTFTYDSLNRMVAATDGSGATVAHAYDLTGHLTTLTYPNGQSVNRTYDAAGHLTSVTDWLGNTTNFTYDANANLTGDQYPNGVNTSRTYDAVDRTTAIVDTGSSGTLANFNYARDPVGQLASETSNNGSANTIHYTRDTLDQLTAANQTPYGYDAANNPTTYGDATQTFDTADELTSSTAPDSNSEVPGEKVKEENPNETPKEVPKEKREVGPKDGTVENPKEPHGDVKGFHAMAPSPTVDTTVSATTHTHSSKLTSPKLRTHGIHDFVLAFISNAGGQHVKHISGDGLRWSLVARSDGAGGTAEVWQAYASRKLHGPITAQIGSGGLAGITVVAFSGSAPYVETHATSQGHISAPLARLTASPGSLLWTVGHSTGQDHPTAPVGGHLVFQFFDKHAHAGGWVQRTTAMSASAQIADKASVSRWGLVAVAIASSAGHTTSISRGRRKETVQTSMSLAAQSTAGGGFSATRHNNANSASDTGGSVTRHFLYNARGDRTQETTPGGATVTLLYDQADRLIQHGTTTYAYNGDGLRASKTVNGTTTDFVWNQAEAMPELLQDGSIYYIYGPDGEPIEDISGSTPTYLHQDQQDSTRLLTDAGGTAVGRYNYDSWGNITSHTGAAATNLQYDGQYTDDETGYQYLRARYYDPSTGRFLIQDPAFSTTQSRYGYALNNPTYAVDPLGLFSWSHALRVTTLVAGGISLAAAGCLLTLCTADAVVAAATGIGIAATVTSTTIDAGFTYYNCAGGGDRGGCAESTVGTGLDIATFGAGGYAHFAYQGAEDAVNFGGSLITFGYGTVTYPWATNNGGGASVGIACEPAGGGLQGGRAAYIQQTLGANDLQ